MLVLTKSTIGAVLLSLLFSFTAAAQFFKNPEQYPAFKNYKHWGIYYANVFNKKATTTRDYGEYVMDNKVPFSFNFGFEKMLYPERRFAFKTGFLIDMAPVAESTVTFKPEDIYPEFGGYTDEIKYYRFLITIPLLVEVKKQMSEHIYFNLETGLHLTIQPSGSFDFHILLVSEEKQEAREVFAVYADNPDKKWIYPNLIISPGLYFAESWGLVQANIIYQNTLINYYTGEYQFGNLIKSPPTRGNYKLSGDYIGVSLSFHFNKTAYRNLFSKEKPE